MTADSGNRDLAGERSGVGEADGDNLTRNEGNHNVGFPFELRGGAGKRLVAPLPHGFDRRGRQHAISGQDRDSAYHTVIIHTA